MRQRLFGPATYRKLLRNETQFIALLLCAALSVCSARPIWAQAPSETPVVPPQQAAPVAPAVVAPAAPRQTVAEQKSVADGSAAEDGSSEKFYAEFTRGGAGEDGDADVGNWDSVFNVGLANGVVSPLKPNSPMGLIKPLETAHPTTLMAQSILYFGSAAALNDSNCVGFNNAEAGSPSESAAQRFAVCLGPNSAYLLNGGRVTPLNLPGAAAFWSVTFWLRANGNLSVSMVHVGTNEAATNYFSGIVPPANLTNFEISGKSANDKQYASRYAVSATETPDMINMAYDGGQHPGGEAVLSTGTVGGVFALIPAEYKPQAPNRAVIYMHGLHEVGWSMSCQAPYGGCNRGVDTMALAWMKAGYVVIGINGTDGCYGNKVCLDEIRTVLAEYGAKLAIGGGLYGFADSMGGFEMLNAISQGVFTPRAIGGCCLNTNLADDYFVDYKAPGSRKVAPQAGSAKSLIDAAYQVTPDHPYETATEGYDPTLASGEGLERLARVPAMFWASPTDGVVSKQYNSDQYASVVKAAGGRVTVVPCQGGHEDASCFDPDALVAFFRKH